MSSRPKATVVASTSSPSRATSSRSARTAIALAARSGIELADQGLGLARGAVVVHGHARAGAVQGADDLRADALRAARDERDAADEGAWGIHRPSSL